MIWTRPWMLVLLLPWAAFVLWQWWRARRTGRWSQVMDSDLLSALGYQPGSQRHKGLSLALAIAGVLLIVALAGPARSLAGGTTLSQGSLVVVLDNSLSMTVQDLAPSRLVRARRAVLDWARSGLFQRTAVITYSGSAHWLTPFTRDVDTLALQLNQLDPYLMPQYGNRPDLAFAKVAEKLRESPNQRTHLLWLTDDASPGQLAAIRSTLTHDGRTWIMPVGTEGGGPIPLPDNQGFLNDGDQMVVPRLDRTEVNDVADALGAQVLSLGQEPNSTWLGAAGREASQQRAVREWGYWLLIPALVLLLPWYRRGVIYLLPLFMVLHPDTASAESWSDWWLKNREQRAYQALQEDRPDEARQLSQRPEMDAAAAFTAGDYDAAIDIWSELDSADAHFNRGNALVRKGELDAALEAYDQAIAQGHPTAESNRAKVQQFLEQQQKQQQSGEQGDESQPSQGDQQNGEEQDGQQQSQQGQEAEQQQGESPQQNAQPQPSEPADEPEDQSQGSDEQDAESVEEEQTETGWPQETEEEPTGEETDVPPRVDDQTRLREQAVEQLLNQVPQAPDSLLKHKFQYQFQQDPVPRESNGQEDPQLW